MEAVIFGLTTGELLRRVVLLAVAVAVAAGISRIVSRAVGKALDATEVPSASIFVNIARGVVWAFAILAVMQPVFGIAPTAFVTALGITSLALSLGLQDTISNLIGGLSLMVGRVVKPGDLVDVGGFMGEVVDVTWRATTVRNRLGDEQIIPNSVLNKTALTKLAPGSEGYCPVLLAVSHNADLSVVEADILGVMGKMEGLLREGAPGRVFFTGSDAYGVQCTVSLQMAPGVTKLAASDALMRGVEGREWLASVVGE